MSVNLPHLPYIKTLDPRLHETFVTLRDAIVSLSKQAGVASSGKVAPPQIQNIAVAAANGIFSVSLTDNSQNHLGINYFIEYADNANFNNLRTRFLGPSRNVDGWNLGNQTVFFRAFSQYQNSVPSPRVTLGGSTPTGVAGGGSAPPTQPAAQGSGSGSGGGYGDGHPRVLPGTRLL